MKSRLTLRLPADLAARLELSATRLKRKRSDIVRLALGQFLNAEPAAVRRPRAVDRVRDLIGSVESGIPDLGQCHRDHLIAHLRRAT